MRVRVSLHDESTQEPGGRALQVGEEEVAAAVSWFLRRLRKVAPNNTTETTYLSRYSLSIYRHMFIQFLYIYKKDWLELDNKLPVHSHSLPIHRALFSFTALVHLMSLRLVSYVPHPISSTCLLIRCPLLRVARAILPRLKLSAALETEPLAAQAKNGEATAVKLDVLHARGALPPMILFREGSDLAYGFGDFLFHLALLFLGQVFEVLDCLRGSGFR